MKWKVQVLVAQSCLTLCDPMDCSLPGSSCHGILQARVLEWVAIPFSRGSSWPRDQIWVFHIAGRFIIIWATRETLLIACICLYKMNQFWSISLINIPIIHWYDLVHSIVVIYKTLNNFFSWKAIYIWWCVIVLIHIIFFSFLVLT